MEEWRPIILDGEDTGYQISNKGRVKSPYLKRRDGLMTSVKTPNGYLHINIRVQGKVKGLYIHRLVATAFLDNPIKKRTVNHKDSNKENNNVENLEWATDFENIKHCFDNELNNAAKPVLLYTLKGEFFKEFVSISEALREIAPHLQSTYGINTHVLNSDTLNSQAYGYQWRMKYGDNRAVYDISDSCKKHDLKTVQLSLDGELINVFNSIADACRHLNKINNGLISQVCKGNGKTAYGYKWMYYDDYLKTQEEIV